MYVPKLYLESTMFNFYFFGKEKEKQAATVRLFDAIAAGRYAPYTSQYVLDELEADRPEKFDVMYTLVNDYNVTVFPGSEEIERLGSLYVAAGIIPLKYEDDAFHIAAAALHRLDFVVSYNYNHIVKLKTIIGTGLINRCEGFAQVGMSTPKESLINSYKAVCRFC